MPIDVNILKPLQIDLAGVHSIDASAGTGKTYTIATLFLRYIVEAGIPIEQVLVTTFTEAATAELRDRLRQRLRAAITLAKRSRHDKDGVSGAESVSRERNGGEVDEDFRLLENAGAWDDTGESTAKVRHRLESALARFDQASIFTIHGFCNQLLTQLVFETQSRFDVEMVDSLDPLISRAIDDYLAKNWCQESSLLAGVMALDDKLREDMIKAAGVAIENPDCEIVGDFTSEQLSEVIEGLKRAKDDFGDAVSRLTERWSRSREDAIQLVTEAHSENVFIPNSYGPVTINNAAAFVDKFVSDPKPELLGISGVTLRGEYTYARQFKGKLRQSVLVSSAADGQEDQVPRDEVFVCLDELFEAVVATEIAEKQLRGHAIAAAVIETREEVEHRKKELGLLSFADMLHLVDDAIAANPEGDLVAELQSRFPVVLVDEFQDTDPVQYRIFASAFLNAVGHQSESMRAFVMIGDPKQSIYRFRGADLNCYLKATGAEGTQSHTMGVNWRSDRSLVAGVLALLGPDAFDNDRIKLPTVQAKYPDRLSYTSDQESRGAVEIHFVPGHPSSVNKKITFRQIQRQMVNDIVSELNDPPEVPDEEERSRKIRPGDIAVLCRLSLQLREIQRALAKAGVPTVLCTQQSVFDTPEAEDLHRVLLALNRPSERRSVTTALATPIFGLNAKQLDVLNGEDGAALSEWLGRLHGWRRVWNERGFMTMWQAILKEAGTSVRLAAQINGERMLTNYRHLGELLNDKAGADHFGPAQLVDWLGRAIQDEENREHAAEQMQIRLESDADAVKLSTIHKSKGLEYPVVYCPSLWDSKTRPRRQAHVLMRTDEQGNLRDKYLLDTGSEDLEDRKAADLEDERKEERRLLYVALTRAKHKCRIYWTRVSSAPQSALGMIAGYTNPGGGQGVPAHQKDEQAFASLKTWVDGLQLDSPDGSQRSVEAVLLRNRTDEPAADLQFHDPRMSDTLPALEPRVASRKPVPPLITTSFSSLAAVATHRSGELEADALQVVDRDGANTESAPEPSETSSRVLLAEMPGGRRVGDLVHNVLEATLLDASLFGKSPEDVEAALCDRLEKQMPRVNLDSDAWLKPLSRSLTQCLTQNLSDIDGCSLLQVPTEDLAPEVGFMLGAGTCGGQRWFDPSRLSEALRTSEHAAVRHYAQTLGAIDRKQMKGFLGGFIDLVFRWKGRWYLLDYKTNKLGPKRDDYAPEALNEAMIHHHYMLQYHLYAVALHRMLAQRVEGYQYGTHFGGCVYLFLRGMDPATGSNSGVYFDLPSETVIESLSSVLAGEKEEAV